MVIFFGLVFLKVISGDLLFSLRVSWVIFGVVIWVMLMLVLIELVKVNCLMCGLCVICVLILELSFVIILISLFGIFVLDRSFVIMRVVNGVVFVGLVIIE